MNAELEKIRNKKIELTASKLGCTCRALLAYTALVIQFAAIAATLAQPVTVEETQIESTRTTSLTNQQNTAPTTAQVPTPVTVLDKDEVASLSQRIKAMQEQIEQGAEKQWLSQMDALTLKARSNALASQAEGLRTSYSKERAQEIERQANELNIAVSNAMKNAPAQAEDPRPIQSGM